MDKKTLNRMKGMIYGLIVGDCLGSYIEFSLKDNHPWVTEFQAGGPHALRRGDWTDDTAMTLAVMDSIVSCNGEVDSCDIMNNFCSWFRQGKYSSNGRCFDIGGATIRALNTYLTYGIKIKNDQSDSYGNGSIMRLAPTIICDFLKSDYHYTQTQKVSNLTHENMYIQNIVEKMAYILFTHLKGEKTKIESSYKSRESASNSGLAGNTLNSALWAFHTTDNFESGMIQAVNLGGDSDTIGAVYGQIAGAYYGYDAIPDKWKENIINKQFVDNLFNSMIETLDEKEKEKCIMNEKNFLRNFVKKAKLWMKPLKK